MTDELKGLRDKVVIPAMLAIGCYSLAAEQLVMATGMAESLFKHTRQVVRYNPNGTVAQYGPALSWWQIERRTHDDMWGRYIGVTKRAYLLDGLRRLTDRPGDPDQLVKNPKYAAAMCRIFYLRISAPLPKEGDWEAMAHYWKRYYNTHLGKGTVDGFLKKTQPVINLYRV